jgi:hypothetical protein
MVNRTSILLLACATVALPLDGRARRGAAMARNRLATGSFHVSRQGSRHWVGTGMLVERFGSTGRLGLVVTNSHNVPRAPGRCYLQFEDAGGKEHRAPVLSTLLDRPGKEYALLMVKLPRGMKGAPTARIAPAGATPSPAVYSIGFAQKHSTPRRGTLRAAVRAGRIKDRGRLGIVDPRDGRPAIPSLRYGYRSGAGFSGAGVFSARTGDLEALHWGNTELLGFSIRSHAVPIGMILADIQKNVNSIPYPKAREVAVRLTKPQGGVR